MDNLGHSIWLIYNSNYFLLLFGVLIFDVPRYVISVLAMAIVPLEAVQRRESDHPSVSVVLSVFNGIGNLMECLRSVQLQTMKPLEVILVDDGSLDGTRALALAAKQQGLVDLFIHHGTRCGKSASINHAVRFAKGDLILCLDDDIVLSADAIEKFITAFDDKQVAIASGSLIIRNLVSRTKCNWVERFGKDLVRCFVSKSFSGAIIEKSLDFSKFRITDG